MSIVLPKTIWKKGKILKTSGLLTAFLFCCQSLLAQDVTVSGRVTDKGAPLPGVSIIVKGTTIGTASDADGKYSLQIPSSSSTLVFSFIGYKSVEIVAGSQTTIDVPMEEDFQALSEVVVTALGIKKDAKLLGYATQKVDGATITKAREPNIMNSLTGKVAGLQIQNQTDFFTNPVIKLRGAAPLIVIDGVPSVDNDLWKVNADDIESFTVLKGATASALYGSIGGSGAIMIVTKRGSKAPKVEINSSTMFQPSFIRIPDVQQTYGNGNNGQYVYVDGSGGGLEGGGWIWGPKLDQPGFVTPQYDSPVDPTTGVREATPFTSRGKDNVENFFRTGMISTNNVSVSGGTDNANFRMSVSHVYQKGIVPNTDLNNTSFGVSGGFILTQKLKADASLTFNRQYTDNFPEVGYGPNNYLYNLVLWIGPDIDIRDLKNPWVPGQEGVQQLNYNKSWYNNPYFQAKEFYRGYYKDNVFGQLKLDYNVLPGLDLTLRTGINQYALNRTYKEPKSYVAYDYVSRGNYTLFDENSLNMNTDLLARYNKKFSDKFTLTASAGVANRWRTFRQNESKTDGLVIPGFYNLSNSENPIKGTNQIQEEKVNSVYGYLDLEILNGIFLGGTARNDWTSTLSSESNSYFYPSVSLAGVITDFVSLDAARISFLKVRGSIARVGAGKIILPNGTGLLAESNNYPWSFIPAYEAGQSWNNMPSLVAPNTKYDPSLKPQMSDTYEVGLDVRFLEGRIGLDVAAYEAHDFNFLNQRLISSASGYQYYLENGGEYTRKGVELTLTGTAIKTPEFSWNITMNWSKYHRYLESEAGSGGLNINIKPGDRTDAIWFTPYLHTPGGQLVLDATNGYPVSDSYQRHEGNTDPDFIYGIQNTFQYKNFALGVSLDGRVGGLMYSTTNQKMWWGGTHPGTVNQFRDDANNGLATYIAPGVVVVEGGVEYDATGNVTSDNRVYAPNTTPVNYISWNINTSNAFLNHYYNQSFMKLREVTLTYRFPTEVLSKTFLKTASISFVGRNLAVITNMPEVDPDSGSDNLQTPSTRNIGFNINLTF